MAAIKPILRTKVDYEAARARIDALRDSNPEARRATNSLFWAISWRCMRADTSGWNIRICAK